MIKKKNVFEDNKITIKEENKNENIENNELEINKNENNIEMGEIKE